MTDTLYTNEWIDANLHKPWKDREVLLRFSDNIKLVGKWNGFYWTDQHGVRFIREEIVTHFYIYERYIENKE